MKTWKERIAESPETLHHIIIYIEVIVLTLLLVSLFLITPGGKSVSYTHLTLPTNSLV